jgi:hypothetical protein
MHETWYLTGLEATICLSTFGSNHHLLEKGGQVMLESGVTPWRTLGGSLPNAASPHNVI